MRTPFPVVILARSLPQCSLGTQKVKSSVEAPYEKAPSNDLVKRPDLGECLP